MGAVQADWYGATVELLRRENRFEAWADVDLAGQSFDWFGAYGGVFLRCDFSETTFQQFSVGHEKQTRFVECVFRRTRFPLANTYFGDVRFERCVFDGARLRDLRVDTAEFIDCTFRGRVWHTIFFGTPTGSTGRPDRSRNEWRGNDFSAADLVDVDFRDIDLRAQRWPADHDEYALIDRVDDRVDAATAAAEQHSDRALRALERLRTRKRDPHGFVLVRRRELGRSLPPQVRDVLWARLVGDYSDVQA
jgi:hypothetical protein